MFLDLHYNLFPYKRQLLQEKKHPGVRLQDLLCWWYITW